MNAEPSSKSGLSHHPTLPTETDERPVHHAIRAPELHAVHDELGESMAVWHDAPGPGTRWYPSELRALATALLETADRLEGDLGQGAADAQLPLFEPTPR